MQKQRPTANNNSCLKYMLQLWGLWANVKRAGQWVTPLDFKLKVAVKYAIVISVAVRYQVIFTVKARGGFKACTLSYWRFFASLFCFSHLTLLCSLKLHIVMLGNATPFMNAALNRPQTIPSLPGCKRHLVTIVCILLIGSIWWCRLT